MIYWCLRVVVAEGGKLQKKEDTEEYGYFLRKLNLMLEI